ncbi:MAG: glyoxalase/bleomycin resistance protein/dioxygenase [Rhodospirillales bacterium]|jgi:catechol 2,3-dioxygenase-like lactoylglutathione lyase family enzyme|nr:glyoxalase/bleomycin resistance protein/dioxygenase [Rhodospirillales bacterium]
MKITGLAHFTIPVTDLKRAEAFYTDVLGMPVVQPERGNNGMVFLDAGGDCVILAKVDKAISTAREQNIHHAFKVSSEDYAKARDELTKKNVRVVFEEDRQGGAVNGPRFYFHDPDGNVLEIIDLTSYKGAV